jgi:hypothetical protein
MVFTSLDPVTAGLWECTDPTDTACTDLRQEPTVVVLFATPAPELCLQQLVRRACVCLYTNMTSTHSHNAGFLSLDPPLECLALWVGQKSQCGPSHFCSHRVHTRDLTSLSRSWCDLAPGSTSWTRPGYSIISTWDLVCGQGWKVRRRHQQQ